MTRPAKCLLAAVFGTVMMLSFAPSGAWWLAPFCLAGLYLLLPGERTPVAFGLGLVFGLGWLGGGVWWLYPGLSSYSVAGRPLAAGLTLALGTYLALFPALGVAMFAALSARLPTRMATGAWRWCAGASLWMLAEWLRANLFGGFPWLMSGVAHATGPLGALAPWIGSLGVGWVSAFLAVMLADCMSRPLSRGRGRSMLGRVGMQVGGVLAVLALLCAVAPQQAWTAPTGRHLSLRLIQGGVGQAAKMTPEGMAEAAAGYAMLADADGADLTLMPETALPVAWDAVPAVVREQWRSIARARRTTLVLGTFNAHGKQRVGTNSAIALSPDGGDALYDYRYDKVHLVPFGEQTWAWSEWLTDRVYGNFGALYPGPERQPALSLPQGRVALGICFESLFDVATADKARMAGVLVNLTNFAWFDGTYAAAQHLQAGQMRARETGRYFVQIGNSGGTAIVGPDGVLRNTLPAEVKGVLEGRVEMMEGQTPFIRFGNAPMMAASLALLLYLLLPSAARARSKPAPVAGSLPVRDEAL